MAFPAPRSESCNQSPGAQCSTPAAHHHEKGFLQRSSQVGPGTPLSLAGAMPNLQRPFSTRRLARIRGTLRHAGAWGGCRRSRRKQPRGDPRLLLCASVAEARHLEGLRSSLACPRCKLPIPVALASVLSLLGPGLALGSSATSLCADHWTILGVSIPEPVPLAVCWTSCVPRVQTLSRVHTCLGSPAAGRRGAQVLSRSGFGLLGSCPGKGERCSGFGEER